MRRVSLTPTPSKPPCPRVASAALLLGLVACEGPRDVAVRVSIPGPDSVETPVTGVGVVALPYDRDSVLARSSRPAPESRAPTPRRSRASSRPFAGPSPRIRRVTLRLGKLRDSVARGQGGPDSLAPRRLRSAPPRRGPSAPRAELDRARRDFVGRSDSLRRRMRQWEDSTYQGWDSVVQGLARRSGRTAVTDTTGSPGMGPLEARAGPLVGLRQELGRGGSECRVVLEHARDQGHAAAVEPHGAAAARDTRGRSSDASVESPSGAKRRGSSGARLTCSLAGSWHCLTDRAAPDLAAAQAKPDSARNPLAGRIRGSATAPVTVYEMSDFQCPYCRTFALTTFPAIDSAYIATGKVRWAFVNFPLTSVHDNALAAAEVATLRRAAERLLARARPALPAPGRLGAPQAAGGRSS